MRGNSFTRIFTIFILLAVATIASCRKDDDVQVADDQQVVDTVVAVSPSLGSFLATSGSLKINIEDTVYTFDAAKDSIAFVKVDTAGSQYFGVTAINKEHTISFGISGLGAAKSKSISKVAGSQFLFNIRNKPKVEYTLSNSAHELEIGKMNLKSYSDLKDSVSAVGTFSTFLSKDAKEGSPFYKVTGSFDLKLK